MAKRILTWEQVAQASYDGGFRGWQCVNMTAISMPESGRDALGVGVNWAPEDCPEGWNLNVPYKSHLSTDWGLWMINDYWNGLSLSDCKRLMDPVENAKRALEIFNARWKMTGSYASGYTAWNAYNNGLHKQWVDEALAACKNINIPGI